MDDGDARALGDRLTELGVARPANADGGYRQMAVFESALLVADDIEIIGRVSVEPDPDASAVSQTHGYRDTAMRLVVTKCELRGLRDIGHPQKPDVAPHRRKSR